MLYEVITVLKPTTALQTAGLYDTPNGLSNAKGLDPDNTTVQLKLQGTYQFRFKQQARKLSLTSYNVYYTKLLRAVRPNGV